MGGEEIGLPDAEVTIRTGQALLGDARWLASIATPGRDEVGEAVIVELPVDKAFPKSSSTQADIAGSPRSLGVVCRR